MATFNAKVSEDTVKYMIFPDLTDVPQDDSLKGSLELLAEKYILKLTSLLTSYIWQNESFNLNAVCDSPEYPPHLSGSTCFDDNIEDEWFIVYLLYSLSRENQNIIIKIQDNDGDFLLIEAAEFLPKWVSPKTSKNRVYIHQGVLHIIPIARSPAEITPIPSGVPSVADAITAVRHYSSVTQASPSIQQAILRRIEGYPRKLHELHHRAHCYVPASVAAILKEEPRLLSSAVKAFYLRDPLDMKACRSMLYFPPETRVMTEVLFTRCLYAQLSSQKYEPDRCIGWNLPRVNEPLYKSHSIGMKLACGFEILATNAKKNNDTFDDISDIDFNNDSRWKRFVKCLQDKGYFRGEIEGSKLYKQLLTQAKDFYIESLTSKNCGSGTQLLQLLETVNVNYEELKENEKYLQPADDDSWMEITPEQLDATLESIANRNSLQNMASDITGTLKSFLHHNSGWEGAEVPSSNKNIKKQKVALSPDAFDESVNNILNFRVPNLETDDSSSSMSGYSDDDSDEVDLGENPSAKGQEELKSSDAEAVFTDIRQYMEQMDRELAKTDVGRSFERMQTQPSNNLEMGRKKYSESDDIDDEEEEDFRPVDVDLTALKNILESYSNQQGLPGPASNLFASMGVQLPQDNDL